MEGRTKLNKQIFQVATVFIGSIVGAGIASGRELNQFFAVYGYKSVIGLIVCAWTYCFVGKMIIEISHTHHARAYSEFIDLVCPKWVATLTNTMLSLSLVSSTAIILSGSSALMHQAFGLPKWLGLIIMIACSTHFLKRKTEGLMQVNSLIVPCFIGVMTCIFIGFVQQRPEVFSIKYVQMLDTLKTNFWPSTFIYASFNIVSIVGIVVPLSHDIRDKRVLVKGIGWGSFFLTIMSSFIAFLMLVNPTYPAKYALPILAVAKEVGPFIQFALVGVIWLEMFSSQVSNIYSLSKSVEQKWGIPYERSIYGIVLLAMPLALVGFGRLIEILYPLYGFLSMFLVISCIHFYYHKRISVTLGKKNKLTA